MESGTSHDESNSAVQHRDFVINYPLSWEVEYIETGIVSQWLANYPDLLAINLDPQGRLANPGSRALFAQYALMYLLRCEAFHSITWLEVGANYKRPVKNQHRLDSQFDTMRRWMGHEAFDSLRTALSRTDLGTWKGEPDLFCWDPDTGQWFFAEAKGRGDKLRSSQFEWFSVCRQACPSTDIRVYTLKPD